NLYCYAHAPISFVPPFYAAATATGHSTQSRPALPAPAPTPLQAVYKEALLTIAISVVRLSPLQVRLLNRDSQRHRAYLSLRANMYSVPTRSVSPSQRR